MLHYKVIPADPQDPWVVFIHGAGGNSKTWNFQVPVFRDTYNILLLDLRDHGLSQLPSRKNKYTFSMISADIFEVLDNEQISKAYFLTLSFGSVLLQDLSMRRPDLVQAAIIAGGIFRANWLVRTYVYFARGLNKLLSYPQMYRLFSWLLMPGQNHQRSRRIYQRQARQLDQKAYLRWISLYDEFFELLDRFYFQPIHFPTLIVMGQQDHIFLTSARNFSKNQRDHVSLEIIPDAGHICNIDQAEKFNELAVGFLENVTNLV